MHLFSHTVYHEEEGLPPGTDIGDSLKRVNACGLELLTGFFSPPSCYKGMIGGVHLPYSTDWHSVWSGSFTPDPSEDVKFIHFGHDRQEMVSKVTEAIRFASELKPKYGVFHAGSVRLSEVLALKRTDKDEDVLNSLTEMMNDVVKNFPKGEPPFTILFENLWWPGLTLKDDKGFRILKKDLDFDNWGLCLDTGHLMNALGNCRNESDSIKALIGIFKGYPEEMKNRIKTVHLQLSTSADYTDNYVPSEDKASEAERWKLLYSHVSKIDQHRPFTDPACVELIDILKPDQITHELPSDTWEGRLEVFKRQRSFFQ